MDRDEVRAEIAAHGWPTVLVTGGEPLLQREVLPLLSDLVAEGRTVLLETSGTLPPTNAAGLAEVPAGVSRIVDLKAPGSCVDPADLDWEGIAGLGPGDDLKIVLTGREDYNVQRDALGQETGRTLAASVPIRVPRRRIVPGGAASSSAVPGAASRTMVEPNSKRPHSSPFP